MGKKMDIIPYQDEKFMTWGNHLIESLTPDIGVADETSQALRSKMTDLSELIKRVVEVQNTARQVFESKKTLRQEIDKLIRAEIRRIKARADYSATAGILMGIEAPTKSTSITGKIPQITASDRTGGVVSLSFNKYGSDKIHFYGQRHGDVEWVMLGDATQSPFTDRRPLLVPGQAELRRYSAVFVKRGEEVGEFSPEVVIACAP